MATSAQISANQANAHLSTGPRTPEGKAVSSQNSMRHGFAAQTVLLPGEDPAEYTQLLLELAVCFPTMGLFHLERAVREMANAEWRLRRARQHQVFLLTDKIEELRQANPDADPARLQFDATCDLWENSKTYRMLLRYETKFERQYEHAQRDYRTATKDFTTNGLLETLPQDWVRSAPAETTAETTTQTPRNAPCPCGSGQKYKRCCGKDAPPVLFPGL
jgi:uncharacterized protein YchJ